MDALTSPPVGAPPAVFVSMASAAEDVVSAALRQHPLSGAGARGAMNTSHVSANANSSTLSTSCVMDDTELARQLGASLRRTFLRLARSSDPAVAAIEPISAVRIRRFVSECGLLRLGSRLCLADVDMALQWRTPHHLPTERERDDADAAATAAAAAPAGTAVAVAAVAAAERAGGGPGFHTSGSALTRRLPELSFNDFCYVTVSLACKAFVKLGARNALRKLLDLLSAMTATSNAATDAVGSNANGDDILVAEGDGSGGGVVQPQGPAVGATPTPAGGGGSASGASSAHWPAAWQSGRAAARPTSMDEVRPVIERERQTLARIFEAYALPRDRMVRRRMLDLVRDFGISPSLVTQLVCQRLFLQLAYGLDDEKTALELVPVADDETASLDLAQFLEWIARLVLECSWLNEQRGYSTPTLQAQGLLMWMDMSCGKDKIFTRRGGRTLPPFICTTSTAR